MGNILYGYERDAAGVIMSRINIAIFDNDTKGSMPAAECRHQIVARHG